MNKDLNPQYLSLCIADPEELNGYLVKLSGKLILQRSTGNVFGSNGFHCGLLNLLECQPLSMKRKLTYYGLLYVEYTVIVSIQIDLQMFLRYQLLDNILCLHLGSSGHLVEWRELMDLSNSGFHNQSTIGSWLHDVVVGCSSPQVLSRLQR